MTIVTVIVTVMVTVHVTQSHTYCHGHDDTYCHGHDDTYCHGHDDSAKTPNITVMALYFTDDLTVTVNRENAGGH